MAWGDPRGSCHSRSQAAVPPPQGTESTAAVFGGTVPGLLFGTTWKRAGWHPTGDAKGMGRGDIPCGTRPGRSVCPQRPCAVALGTGASPFFHLTPLWGLLRGGEDPCLGAWPLLPLPQHPADGAGYCSGPLAKQREERREGKKFPQTADSPGEPARSGTRCQRSCWLEAGLGNQP